MESGRPFYNYNSILLKQDTPLPRTLDARSSCSPPHEMITPLIRVSELVRFGENLVVVTSNKLRSRTFCPVGWRTTFDREFVVGVWHMKLI